MSPVPRWFDRKFEFGFPPEQHPNLCVRLRGTPVRLEEIVRGCSHDVLVRKPQGKWSAQEHAGHLLDLEPLWMARVNDFLSGNNELTAADLGNRGVDLFPYAREMVIVMFRGEVKMIQYPHRLLQTRVEHGVGQHSRINRLHSIDELQPRPSEPRQDVLQRPPVVVCFVSLSSWEEAPL